MLLISPSVCAKDNTAQMIYADAYGHLIKNNLFESKRLYEKGIKIYPNSSFLYAGLGDVYLKEKKYDKALEYYTQAQRKSPANPNYKISFYNVMAEKINAKIQSSVELFFAASKNATDNAVIAKNIMAVNNEDYTALRFITDFYQDFNDKDLQEGNQERFNGKYDKAVKAYQNTLLKAPDNYKALNNIALLYMDKKDFKTALVYLKKSEENNKNSSYIYNNLAVCSFYLNNYNEMNSYFDKALKSYKDYSSVYNNRAAAEIYIALNSFNNQNIAALAGIAKSHPDNIFAKRTLASLYNLKGDYSNAAAVINTANNAYNFNLFYLKALYNFKNKDYLTANADIDKAISLYSSNPDFFILKARILSATGDLSGAAEYFEKSISKRPSNNTIYYYYAQSLAKIGRFKEAGMMMSKYLEMNNIKISSDVFLK
ncbi:MAG: tetratricopeptide repeat protein [Candidatus Gastranaerophilales bacterium]|nr:tetratricopeptide repeat protein [Candidatus Gastranaerophilales bacterium]